MFVRAAWAAVIPAALAAAFALWAEDPAGPLGTVVVLLLIAGAIRASGDGPEMRGTVGQNVTQVLLGTFAVVLVGGLLMVAFVTLLGAGLDAADERPGGMGTTGVIAAAMALVVALAVVLGAILGWRRIDQHRVAAGARSPRTVALLPAAGVGLVLGVVVLLAGTGSRERPEKETSPLATLDCGTDVSSFSCGSGLRLSSASSADGALVAWRSGTRVDGALLTADGRTKQVVLARGLPAAGRGDRASALAVAPLRAGGFVVAWSVGPQATTSVLRVTADGAPAGAPQALPAPGPQPSLAAVDAGGETLLFAGEPAVAEEATPSRLRALRLDGSLRARGGWRTLVRERSPTVAGAAVVPGGAVAVARGSGAVQTTLLVDPARVAVRRTLSDVLVAVGPRGARVLPVPRWSGARSDGSQRPPRLVEVVLDGAGRSRALWTTEVRDDPREPRRVEQQRVIGPGLPRDGALVAEGLTEPRLVTAGDRTVLVGVRPADRSDDEDRTRLVLARVP